MNRYIFERKQFLPISIDQAWNFFSDPRNLARITPTSLDFQIISTLPEGFFEGLIIEYRIKPFCGIPIKWVSLIKDIKAPYEFIDFQEKGPYHYWHHRHRFQEVPGGVIMEDIIHYELPLKWLSSWLNEIFIVKQLNQIFDFRYQTLSKYNFPKGI